MPVVYFIGVQHDRTKICLAKGKKRHDPLIWKKEKREKGQKRETSGSNQEAVSLKRRRIVKEIRSTEQKKRTKKHL